MGVSSLARPGQVALLAAALGLASCDPPAAQPVKAPTTAPAATASAEPTSRLADPVLLDVVPMNATIVARVDLAEMRIHDEWRGVLEGLPPAGPLLEWSRQCGIDVAGSMGEAVVAWADSGPLIALRLKVNEAKATDCALQISGGPDKALTVAGRPGARVSEDMVFVARNGVALIGTKAGVEGASARMDSPPAARAAILEKLPLGQSMILSAAISGWMAGDLEVNGTFQLASKKLVIDLDVVAPSPEEASEAASRLKARVDQVGGAMISESAASARKGGKPEHLAAETIRKLVESIAVRSDVRHVRVGMGLEGEPLEIVSGFGSLTAVAVFGARRYLASAKTAEAKNTVGAIARALAAKVQADLEAERKKKGGKPSRVKFPPSAPPTPPTVPSGIKVVPAADAWSQPTWKAIGFRMDSPVYYSYEIEVSKDGKTAVVRARGDLDGDAEQSFFEIPLTITPEGELHVSTQMRVENELE